MNGAVVGITAVRRANEQAALVRSLGGVPRNGPSIDIDVPAPDGVLREILCDLLAAPLDMAVFVTGVGTRHMLGAATREGMIEPVLAVLRATRVIARSPKPRKVLREFAIPIQWMSVPSESRVIRDALLTEPLAGRRILVQCAGAYPDVMIAPLRAAGADVLEAHPYEIDIPADGRAAVDLAEDAIAGRLDALTFTSVQAVYGFVAIAERAGVDIAAIGAGGALIVAVGPVTRDALLEHGLPVHVEPEITRMGAMYHALAAALAVRNRSRPPDALDR